MEKKRKGGELRRRFETTSSSRLSPNLITRTSPYYRHQRSIYSFFSFYTWGFHSHLLLPAILISFEDIR
ncbi:unnamed protein product [Caenorhabditis nigoni]